MGTKNYLLGVFETSLFMRIGTTRFTDDLKVFRQSFYVLLLNIPLIYAVIPQLYVTNPKLMVISLNLATFLFIAKYILFILITIWFIYFVCRLLDRKQHFIQYVTALNWLTITSVVLYVPFVILMKLEVATHAELVPYIIVIMIYVYAVAAFLTKHTLQIPWELSIAIAICYMAIDEVSMTFLYLVINLMI